MQQFDAAIIGFGTAGRALGAALADAGQTVAMIEQSNTMYGGACVNNACIPTKSLVASARLSAAIGGPLVQQEERYAAAIDRMNELRTQKRANNYHALADRANVEIIDGRATFADSSHLVVGTAQKMLELESERIFIDTGSLPSLPSIPGAKSPRVYVSASLLDVRTLPHQLVVIGAGFVGLEFASLYTDFGCEVTLIQPGEVFLPQEDAETARIIYESLEARGITIMMNTSVTRIDDEHDQVLVLALHDGKERRIPAHAVLLATGRTPNVAGLGLDEAGIALNDRGGIAVDERLRTTAPNVWAMGDVTGGEQFTYLAYDDYRIVASDVLGDGTRTTVQRGAIPRCTFIHPPFARIGITADEAHHSGIDVRIVSLPAANISQAHILQDKTGIMKAVVDVNTNLIVGMDLFCEDAQELINLVKIVMDARIPVIALRDAIFTHPSMTEAFNNLFADFVQK